MLRLASITTACVLMVATSAFAQSTPIATTPAPETPPAAEATVAPEPMEDVQTGDHWTYEIHDEITGDIKSTNTNVVTEVTPSEITTKVATLGSPNSGFVVFDHSWNVINNGVWKSTPNDGTGFHLPLTVGKTWTFKASAINSTRGFTARNTGTSKVVAQEKITTTAGTFETFKIETSFTSQSVMDPTKKVFLTSQTWYAPAIDHWVKRTAISRQDNRVHDSVTAQLVEYGRR